MHVTNMFISQLKQAPRAQYDRLTEFLMKNGYMRGSVDKTLFIKISRRKLIIVQVYVDDIVFGGTSQTKVDLLVEEMKNLK